VFFITASARKEKDDRLTAPPAHMEVQFQREGEDGGPLIGAGERNGRIAPLLWKAVPQEMGRKKTGMPTPMIGERFPS